MSATIRPATIADAQAIARVHVDTWKSTYQGIVPQDFLNALDTAARAEQWQEWLTRGDSSVFVVEEADGICGFCGGGRLREELDGYDGELYAVYVLAEAQRRGIGRKLMRALVEVLAQQGFARLALWVLADNPSRNFYAHLGGKPIAEKPIQIGEAHLVEVAYGWESLSDLASALRSTES